jgi:dTDP-4-amino-4,6-dideoxygalactose transaminase
MGLDLMRVYASSWPGLSPAHFLRAHAVVPPPVPMKDEGTIYFYRARNAIYHLVRALAFQPGESVLVPDYHSGNEVAAILAAGASVRYYPIRRNLEPDLDALDRLSRSNASALLVIHFFGWPQPLPELQELCRERGMVLIEDCALALLSESEGRPLGTFGDYAVYCLYKTLPVPNGAALVQNRGALGGLHALTLMPCGAASVAGRSAELLLEQLRSRANGFGDGLVRAKHAVGRALTACGVPRVPVGDIGFDLAHVDIAMSHLSEWLLERFDYDSIRRRRRENAGLMRERLPDSVVLIKEPMADGVCPLFFPIVVAEKRAAAEALRRRGIGAIECWNTGYPGAVTGPDAAFLRQHVLELPIHQDITAAQVQYMADQVSELRLHL